MTGCRILSLAAALLIYGAKGSALSVTISPSHGEISVSESKFFTCSVSGDADSIKWFDPRGAAIESSDRLAVAIVDNDATLTIYRATIDDAGIYKCVASAAGAVPAEATVVVNIYQRVTFKEARSPQEFKEGDDAIVECHVISSPEPAVMWKFNERNVMSKKDARFSMLTNHYLQIRGIRKSDEGVYRCEGLILSRGEIDYRDIRVLVNVAPTVRVRHSFLNATSDRGESAHILCTADGFPEPVITWTRNGELLEASEKYALRANGSELVVKNVVKSDDGEYVCSAENKVGEQDAEVTLKVFAKPEITYLENKTTTEQAEQIVLTCEAEGEPLPTITWRRVSDQHVFRQGQQTPESRVEVRLYAKVSSLTLRDVQYTDAGEYLCIANNNVGRASAAMHLDVEYGPKFAGEKVTFHSWPNNPVNLTCEVLANPKATVSWSRDGQPIPSANLTNVLVHSLPGLSMLEITPELQSDFGSYNCVAVNKIGKDSKEFVLVEAALPSAPQSVKATATYSTSAEITLEEPDYTGGVPILTYTVRVRPVNGLGDWISYNYGGGEDTVKVTNLEPNTHYMAEVSARNGVGEGPFTKATMFHTEPILSSYRSMPRILRGPVKHVLMEVQLKRAIRSAGEDGTGAPLVSPSAHPTSSDLDATLADTAPQSTDATGDKSPSPTPGVSESPAVASEPPPTAATRKSQTPATGATDSTRATSPVAAELAATIGGTAASSAASSAASAEPATAAPVGFASATPSEEATTRGAGGGGAGGTASGTEPPPRSAATTDPAASDRATESGRPASSAAAGRFADGTTARPAESGSLADGVVQLRDPLAVSQTTTTVADGDEVVAASAATPGPAEVVVAVTLSRSLGSGPLPTEAAAAEVAPSSVEGPVKSRGEPSPPQVHGSVGSTGNSYVIYWVLRDDGGSPIQHYLVKHRPVDGSAEWLEQRAPSTSKYAMLSSLKWNTEYEVHVRAINKEGDSDPAEHRFTTQPKPTANTGDDGDSGILRASGGMGTGAIIGIVIVIFLILLVAIDVTCYFLKKCGLLMCITVSVCGKAGPSGKGAADPEQGKASYSKEESKEPIVEVKTEEEVTANHEDGGPASEPTETTPLTQPEKSPAKEEASENVTAPAAAAAAIKPDDVELKTVPSEATQPVATQNESKA